MDKRIVISGCSGGGKSTLLAELSQRGYSTVEEAGRRIVDDVAVRDPASLPWNNLAAFAELAIAMTQADMAAYLGTRDWVFFDRSLVDAVAALRFAGGKASIDLMSDAYRYSTTMFLAPPWEEIYETDEARRHSFAEGAAEAARLEAAYRDSGYEVRVLPKASVIDRADWIEQVLGIS